MREESKSSLALRGIGAVFAGLALLLAACGQKGPLTLPAAASVAPAAPAAAASVPAK